MSTPKAIRHQLAPTTNGFKKWNTGFKFWKETDVEILAIVFVAACIGRQLHHAE